MFIYTLRAAQAEFERQILSQRTKEGMAAARARGAKIGRPRSIDDGTLHQARTMIAVEATSLAETARRLGVKRWTLSRALKRTPVIGES